MSCRNAANNGAGGKRQERGEGAGTLSDEGAGMEREGAGMEREGVEMKRGEGEAGILSVSRALAAKAWRREIPRGKVCFISFCPS